MSTNLNNLIPVAAEDSSLSLPSPETPRSPEVGTGTSDHIVTYEVQVLPLEVIHIDHCVQARVALSSEVVEDYAGEMSEGATFPPLIVFHDDGRYLLADGFHRYRAALQAGRAEFKCEVRLGALRDAMLFAAGANVAYGLRRSNEDKRHAVLKLLRDEEWGQWADREVARHCGVGHQLVGKLRTEHAWSTGRATSDGRKYVTRYGSTTKMVTRNIGKKSKRMSPKAASSQTDEILQSTVPGATEPTATAKAEPAMPTAESNDAAHPERQIDPDEAHNALIDFAKFVIARTGRKGKTFVVSISAKDASEFHPLLANAKLAIGE